MFLRRDPSIKDLNSILLDKDLAKLGDSYVNFLYSMALTMIHGVPKGVRVSDRILAQAAKESGLRDLLPKRTPRGKVADAMESLIVYSLIMGHMGFREMIHILTETGDLPDEGFAKMAKEILRRLEPSEGSC
ncbi:MAG: ribonuclease III family protein [Candidatus Bathyarchaeia archaeon]